MTLHLAPVDLGPGVRAVFTGRGQGVESVGAVGNLSHRRPHRPGRLARDRAAAAEAIGLDDRDVIRLRQVHGNGVVVIDADVPVGAEVGPADGAVTAEVGRGLAVLVADCVPVLFASEAAVAVAHAGRAGVVADIVAATVQRLRDLHDGAVRAAIGPAIRGCCYEVEDWLRDEVADAHPAARSTTTWGTPSLDLPAAVAARLTSLDVAVDDLGACTHCDDRWFSHRRDGGAAGRQAGLVVRTRSSAPAHPPSAASRSDAARP